MTQKDYRPFESHEVTPRTDQTGSSILEQVRNPGELPAIPTPVIPTPLIFVNSDTRYSDTRYTDTRNSDAYNFVISDTRYSDIGYSDTLYRGDGKISAINCGYNCNKT
jgi:hypothetical protein